MRLISAPLGRFFLKILLLMGIYSLMRLMFLFFNFPTFQETGAADLGYAFLIGIRFDLVAVTIINLPLIALYLLPYSLHANRWHVRTVRLLLIGLNLPFILANCIDLGLFRFSSRRLTSDIFSIMGFGDDLVNTVPKMVMDFWPQGLVFVFMTFLLVKATRPIHRAATNVPAAGTLAYSLSSILLLGGAFIGFRGGLQYKPLTVISASQFGGQTVTPLILNSSFTLIKSFGKDEIRPVCFMPESAAGTLAPTCHPAANDSCFTRKNVVILILEGIGKEYVGSLSGKETYTPFLDSLSRFSFVCRNAFANGKRSIEGIPAVLASVPTLCEEPFISSPFATNKISSVANLLKPYGYTSVFFHGGSNGTMGFDHFSRVAGFDRYFGRTEYGDDRDFDGNWGIYDVPFLQRTVQELSRIRQPFATAVFTLSSHHPYAVPAPYDSLLPDGKLPILKSVRYTDLALREFFRSAAKEPWYKNTLFVITSDHTSLAADPYFKTRAGIYSIPLLFFDPSGIPLQGTDRTAQQIDVVPSVMHLLGYPEGFFSFGSDVFNGSAPHFAVNFLQGTYQLIEDNHSMVLDTLSPPKLFDLSADPLQYKDVSKVDTVRAVKMESRLRAFIQNYNMALLENRMFLEAEKREDR